MATDARLVLVLVHAARDLYEHATITHPLGGHPVPVCMTTGLAEYVVRNPRIRAILPPVTGTVTEYATRIRDLAATL